VITSYVKARRWFRAKARGLVSATIDETFALHLDGETVDFDVIACAYEDGATDRYVLPIATATGAEAERLKREQAHLVIGEVAGRGTLYDALGSERLLAALLGQFASGSERRVESQRGALVFRAARGHDAGASNVAPRPTKTEQTNTSIVFGDAFILKVVRKLDEGVSAELEMGEFLMRHGYASSPHVVGAIEIERSGAEPSTVGILHRFVPNQGDAWTSTLKELEGSPSPERYLPRAALLGKRVGEMHVVLAAGTEANFVPERIDRDVRANLVAMVRNEARSVGKWLREGDEARIASRLDAFVELGEDPVAMRIHGDLHLGQILSTGDDYMLIDFEGEPARSLAERKAKRSPLADVAGMLRSFDYAAATALRAKSAAQARAWYRAVASAFLEAYRSATCSCAALAISDTLFHESLDFYLLEKCVYEIAYEANNRPDWIAIPRDGLGDLLDAESTH
jgi:trehalose synthase-fused probable maltokinase